MALFQRTCLKPSYSLRRQLLLGFGSSAFLTIVVVVTLAGIFANEAGNTVQNRADSVLREQVVSSFVNSTHYVAERFAQRLASTDGALQLLVEATRDRIVGYPLPGWEEDRYVPFFDTEQQRNVYPLNMPPAPLDWNMTSNLLEPEDYYEHFQDRVLPRLDAAGESPVTTASGVFLMQGSCNPDQKDPNGLGYYEGCTDSNNDIEAGGILQPVNTTKYFHRVSGDLVALAKPIFEAQKELLLIGIYFVNRGAGASVYFPGQKTPNGMFVSEGCDWMKDTNPYTNKPFGTAEEIARCHPKGQNVSTREYNPLIRGWIQGVMKDPDDVFWIDPFLAYDVGARVVCASKAVFDRITGALIGADLICIAQSVVNGDLEESRLHGEASDIAIVQYKDSTVFADTMGTSNLDPLPKIYDTDFISEEYYNLTTSPLNTLFSGKWDPKDLQQAYEKTVVVCQEESKIYSAVPLPLPPPEYDPMYHPRFIVINSVSFDVFDAVDEMDERIEEDFVEITVASICLGIVGMVIVFFIVWCVSRMLTKPLLWIDDIAWSILNPKDHRALESLRVADDDKKINSIACTRTEITKLVIEFRSLINCFSGTGTSTVAESNRAEIPNEMTWRSDFKQLYAVPAIKKKLVRVPTTGTNNTNKTDAETLSDPLSKQPPKQSILARNEDNIPSDSKPGPVVVPAPMKKNQGRNLTGQIGHLNKKNELENEFSPSHARAYRSSLFWWILVLIALPLVLTNALICGIVSYKMVNAVPQWVDIVEESSLVLEKKALNVTAVVKASVAELLMQDIVRDLHLVTRMAGWLLFGGLQRSGALIDMNEATEDCKKYPRDLSCPFFDSGRPVCDCDWNDITGIQCVEFSDKAESRALQLRHWHTQARDADPVTGNRPSAQSYPEFDSQPNETLWWNTTEDLPGREKGSTASGFETAYDRIRTTSAMAVVDIPIANYANALGRQRQDLGTYVGFDADGTLTGYTGCDYNFTYMSYWVSTEDNHAEEIASHLCPLGKYGYDSRCREWYATGKNKAFTKQGNIHLTAPYTFASSKKMIAMSATFPMANPQTGQYAGQTLLDFTPALIRQVLRRLEEPFGFMITPGYDRAGGDTVIAPSEMEEDWKSADILDLLFENETASSGNREYFRQDILPNMKKGEYNVTTYRRWLDGMPEESLVLAYRPVYVDAYQALNPGTFHRGVNLTKVLAYSIGIVCSEEGLRRPFQEIEDYVMDDLTRLQIVYICLVVFISVAFTVFTCLITVSITKPMITLLRVVERINAGGIEDELPPLQGGSREVHQVYNSFAKLIKIVRMSNIAFFSGNLEQAHEFISDALKLYRKIEDEKAIGIACNNLGNTLYAILHEAKISGGLDADTGTVVEYDTAISHFNCAVEIGQRQFDKATGVDDKSEFAQQLADRLFNRALFGLLAESCGLTPDGAKESALADFQRVRELDYDVKDFWLDRKLLLDKSGVCYSRLLRRIHGLIDFYEDEMVRELWNPKELIEEADQLLFAAWNERNAPIFEEHTPVGRLQQLEGATMRLDLLLGEKVNAARLAMRIFSEDEYILESTFSIAAEALLSLMRDIESETWSATTKALARQDLRHMARGCKSRSLDLGKCVILGFEINEQFEGDPMLDKVRVNCEKLYDLSCSTDDYFGIVAHTIDSELNLDLCSKAQYHEHHRAVLDVATSSTTDKVCPVLPFAVQMIVDSTVTTEIDSYIILIADGYSFDPATYSAVKVQLDRLNQERKTTVHLIILGMDVEEEEVVEACKEMCTISKLSLYADINLDNMDSVFDAVGGIITGRALTMGCFLSLTMEKF